MPNYVADERFQLRQIPPKTIFNIHIHNVYRFIFFGMVDTMVDCDIYIYIHLYIDMQLPPCINQSQDEVRGLIYIYKYIYIYVSIYIACVSIFYRGPK